MSDAFVKAASPKGDYVKLKSIGDTVTIGVTGVTERQELEFGSRTPRFFPSGDPIMEQVIAGVKLDPEDYSEIGDVLFVINKPLLRERIGHAIKEAGGDRLEEGAVITITYTGDGPAKKGSSYPPKDFAVQYELPGVAE